MNDSGNFNQLYNITLYNTQKLYITKGNNIFIECSGDRRKMQQFALLTRILQLLLESYKICGIHTTII